MSRNLLVRNAFVFFSMFALFSCGLQLGSKDKSPDNTPKTPEEALARLTPKDRANFDQWKSRLQKSCNSNEAFPEKNSASNSGTQGLDVQTLLSMTSQSLFIQDDQGRFALLGEPSYPAGMETSKSERSAEVNGQQVYELKAEFKRTGGECTASLWGVKVYSTAIAQSFPVQSAWDPSNTDDNSVTIAPKLSTDKTGAMGIVSSHGFETALFRALMPKRQTIRYLSFMLGLAEETTKTYFQLNDSLNARYAITFPKFDVLPFSGADNRIIGPAQVVSQMADGVAHRFTLRLAVQPGAMKFPGGVSNSADESLLTFDADLRTAPAQNTPNATKYTVTSVGVGQRSALDDLMAVACLDERWNTLQRIEGLDGNPFQPGYRTVSGPCSVYTAQESATYFRSPAIRSQVLNLFSGITGSRQRNYGGWDRLLRDFGSLALAQEKVRQGSIRRVLDPNGQSSIIRAFSDYQDWIEQARAAAGTFGSVQSDFSDLSFSWALYGISVAPEKVTRIFKSLGNTIESFPESTLAVFDAVRLYPDSQDEILTFAATITPAYKETARRIRTASSAVGLDDWASSMLGTILQKRISPAQLDSWNGTLNAAQAFAARDAARVSDSHSFRHESSLKEVINRAMAESWDEATFAAFERMALVARYRSFCDTYSDASSLATCVGMDVFTKTTGKLLDPAFKNRYGEMADDVSGYMRRLNPETSFYSERREITDAFFKPIWGKCDNVVFSARRAELNNLMDRFISEQNWFKRNELWRTIQKKLEDC